MDYCRFKEGFTFYGFYPIILSSVTHVVLRILCKSINLICREITCLYLAIIFEISSHKLTAYNLYLHGGSKMIGLISRQILISYFLFAKWSGVCHKLKNKIVRKMTSVSKIAEANCRHPCLRFNPKLIFNAHECQHLSSLYINYQGKRWQK